MTTIQVIFSSDFIIASLVYVLGIAICVPVFSRIHARLEHPFLRWQWQHIWTPLMQAGLIVTFILIAYPVLYGTVEAPAVTALFSGETMRLNYLLNTLFLLTLLFPLVPVVGEWQALVFPLQGIAASALLFAWLAESRLLRDYTLWPGLDIFIYCLALALITHRLAMIVADEAGERIDNWAGVTDSGALIAECLVLFLQSPVILLFSLGLGRQLHVS